MEVKIKRLYEDAKLPTKAHTTDAGFDLYAHSRTYDEDGNIVYGSGVAMEIPQQYVGLVFPRSSNAKKDLFLTNGVGVIDADYRGEITFKFKPCASYDHYKLTWLKDADESKLYNVGERIGQIIIMPYPEIEFKEVNELSETDRGTGGYGSSGK